MGLVETLKQDLNTAMKARDKTTTSVLRMVLSEITYSEKSMVQSEPEKCLKTYRKRLVDAAKEARDDSAREALKSEIGILDRYLPKAASHDEMLAAVRAQDLTQPFGSVIKAVLAQLPNANGKELSSIIQAEQSK